MKNSTSASQIQPEVSGGRNCLPFPRPRLRFRVPDSASYCFANHDGHFWLADRNYQLQGRKGWRSSWVPVKVASVACNHALYLGSPENRYAVSNCQTSAKECRLSTRRQLDRFSMPVDWNDPGSLVLLDIHTMLDRQDRTVELRHSQPKAIQYSRLPSIREALFLEHRPEVFNSSPEDCQHRGRATSGSIVSSILQAWGLLTSRYQTCCGRNFPSSAGWFAVHLLAASKAHETSPLW